MKKLVFALALCFCFQFIYAEKYALIIAVGDYPKKTGWSSISSVNDVPLIEQTLLKQGFAEDNIEVLINEDATFNGITTSLNNLLKKVKSDDIVVIHYSGHGQQIFDDNGEEIDGKDEALVPYDAWVRYTHNYKGENHLRDDDLGNYITKFRNTLGTNGQLLLLLDSCHSGSSTRGGKARGSQGVFAPEGWKPNVKEGESKGSDMTEDSVEKLSDNPAPFVLISGASANELNYEYKGQGSLSYAFSKAMSNLGDNFSYNQLFAKMQVEMNIIAPRQNPTIEGDINVKLFKNEYVQQQTYYEVVALPQLNRIMLQAGKIHGLFEGTIVNVLPSGTTEVTEDKIITKGEVKRALFNKSYIVLDNPLADFNVKNYWVFVDQRSYGDIAVDIYFDNSLKDKTIKKGVSDFLSEKKLGNIVKEIDSADAVLMQRGNQITLNSIAGLDEVDKNESTRGSTTVDAITQKIFDFAQGQYLKKISVKNYDYEFEFKLLPVEVEYDEFTDKINKIIKFLPEEDFLDENGIFQVKERVDHVVVQVTNKSEKPLYFSIIELNTRGEINPFLPNDNYSMNDDERKLNPGQTMVFEKVIFSFGPPYEKLVLKAFAAPYPINFKSTVKSRGAGTRSATNPLESFLADTYTQTRGSIGKKRTSAKLDAYTTEFIYEIVRE